VKSTEDYKMVKGFQSGEIKNILTIDLEDWSQGNEWVKLEDAYKYEDRIESATAKLLDVFDEYKIKVTFFVLGHIAEKKRNLINEINFRGHEVGTHGYSHELIYNQTSKEFEYELKKAIYTIEDIVGTKVLGHRASNWSITKKSLWALDILKKNGIIYDSSIFPVRNFLYGIPAAPRFSYKFPNGLIEIPPSTARLFGQNVPFSGGFYLRVLPYWFIEKAIRLVNKKGRPAVMYLHPWDLDIGQPKNLDIPFKNKIIHYVNLAKTEIKLRRLLNDFKFGNIREYLPALQKCLVSN
jgi:polysaccharide deacetylase family protein (PEP-CTERM system associated)